MFLDYYHLREQPFGVTPDPRYLYLGRAHREALASLYYGIEAGRGFMALIAEPGMGKTTLLNRLMERLHQSACVAFLFQTQCNSRELLRYLLADMGLESGDQDPVNLHAQLNQALVRMSRAGRRFVLVIDEAQNLDSSVLETVRLLSDFETPSSKLIQIILSGQPQLAGKLASPPLVQLRQRIAILSRLEPFSPEEAATYIDHRLRVAGHNRGRLFTSEAKSTIAARSQGIPRNINNLCFNALSLGCALGRREIDRGIVLETVRDLDVEPLGQKRYPPPSEVLHAPHPAQTRAAQSTGSGGFGSWAFHGATLASFSLLASLFLFAPVRSACKNSLTKVWAAVLPLAKSIELGRPTSEADISATSAESRDHKLDRVTPGFVLPGGKPTVGRASFSKALITHLPVAETVQIDHLMVPPAVSITSSAPQSARGHRLSRGVTSAGVHTVVVDVKPQKTLSQICLDHYGRFDRELARQILALNPKITDANHIEVGQLITLPGEVRTSKRNNAIHPPQ